MTLDPNTHLLVCDVETTGLDPEQSDLIEVGFAVVDLDLHLADSIEIVCRPDMDIDWTAVPPLVREMHEKSGLRKVLDNSSSGACDYEEAEAELLDWYTDLFGDAKMPLMGSSVHFDRRWLQAYFVDLSDKFHYRNIDVSSLKELCRQYNPEVYAELPPKMELHRAGPDIVDTLNEFRFYVQNFLFTTQGS